MEPEVEQVAIPTPAPAVAIPTHPEMVEAMEAVEESTELELDDVALAGF